MSSTDQPPLPAWLAAIPASIHEWIVGIRNRRFDRGVGVVTLDRPVISVGNLSVGGTGKTPLTLEILRWLLEAGAAPAVAMRGYGHPGGLQSDEARLYLRAYPRLPVVAQPDRLGGLLGLFGSDEGEAVSCVVLDDGFQHRRIARQADILVIDATRPAHLDRMLPAGWLREPVTSVSRATAVVVTHARRAGSAACNEIRRSLDAAGGPHVVALCDHDWSELRVNRAEHERSERIEWLRGRNIVATCAIGRPESFLHTLTQSGANISGQLVLPDHDPFGAPALARLMDLARASGASAVVCTEKDWSKLSRVRPELWPCEVARPRVSLRFGAGEEELRAHVLAAATQPVE